MALTSQMHFGPFFLDLFQGRLWRGVEVIALRPRTVAVLAYLVAQPGRLVPREELLQQVWRGAYVSGAVVRTCIRDIRAALSDDAASPQYLETVGRQGYRFLGTQDGNTPVRLEAGAVVGRQAEVTQLQQCYMRAADGARQLVILSGEVGIGKTTVVDLFLASLMRQGRTIGTVRGQCVEHYGAGEPYLPVLEALGHLGQAPGGERVVAVLRRYAPMWLAQLPALVPEAEWDHVQRRVWGMTRLSMLRELADAVVRLTAETPLVLVLEDLHWSDPATIDVLSYLAQRREPARRRLLGTYRPEDAVARHHPVRQMVQVLSGRGLCTEMRLQELSAAEVMAYATGHLGGPVEPALAALLYRHTGGHALFLVQMLEHLAQQGLLVRAAGQWTLREDGATTTVGIPAQLQHLVTRRFEALPTTTQCVGGSGRGRPRVYRGGRGGGTAPPHSGGRQSV
jgi:DNA-binding winged helix-turn-helix (wHTH) protein